MDLQRVRRRDNDHVVLVVTGLADVSSAPELHSSLRGIVGDHAGERVTIDLDGVSGLDDAALGLLLGAATRARELGGSVELVCSNERVRRRLAATRLDELVEVRESGAEASASDSRHTAVIFTSQRTESDHAAYDAEATRMERLAREQPGYLGIESARGPDGVGVTVSYWASTADATAWKHHPEHLPVQRAGRERWYRWYRVRVADVTREYSYDQGHVHSDPN